MTENRSENDRTTDLKPLLATLGLTAIKFDETVRTKTGGVLKPDLQFYLDGRYYVLEAKSEPQRYDDATSKARKDIDNLIEPVLIAFAVLWPKGSGKIRAGYLTRDKTQRMQTFQNTREIAEWIHLTCKTTKIVTEPINTDRLLNVLNDLVERFYSHYKKVPLDDIMAIFGGKSFFETVLEEKSEESVQSVRKIASFLMVNQLFFYGILSKRIRTYDSLPKEIQNVEQLQKLFDRVLDDDYAPIFAVPVLKLGKDGGFVATLNYAINVVRTLLTSEITHDVLGKVFHNLIPLKLRKVVAAYYTNSEAGDLLARLAIERPDSKVFDPACGSGTLLVSSYHRKAELYAKTVELNEDTHRTFLQEHIFGADIMPFASHLAAINMVLQKPETFVDKLNILIEDSTELSPGKKVAGAEEKLGNVFGDYSLHEFVGKKLHKKIARGAVVLKHKRYEPVELPKFDLVIMNPPFTRFQRLSKPYKERLEKNLHEYKKYIHGQLGLQGYFLLLADRFLKHGGRVAAVLPVTTFTLKGFFEIIKLFFSNYKVEFIIAGTGRAAFSENTSLREVLFVAKKEKPEMMTKANVCFISQSPSDMDTHSVASLATKLLHFRDKNSELSDDDLFIRKIPQEDVVKNPRHLAHLLNLPLHDLQEADETYESFAIKSGKFSQGKDIFKALNWGVFENKRGVEETGYYSLSILPRNSVVAKDHDYWLLEKEGTDSIVVKNRNTEKEFRVPKDAVVPQFRRFSGHTHISLDPPSQFVIVNSFPSLAQFLKSTDILENKVSAITKRLASLELKKYFTDGSGNAFLFYRGNLSAPNTNLLFVSSKSETFGGPGGSWIMRIDKNFAPLLSIFFNSSFFLLQLLEERKETEGAMLEVDKYALENIYIPDPRKLSEKEFDRIEKLYNELKSKDFPSIAKQLQEHHPLRMKIDMEIAVLLGVPEGSREKLILNLQNSLARYINILKSTMMGK